MDERLKGGIVITLHHRFHLAVAQFKDHIGQYFGVVAPPEPVSLVLDLAK